MPLNPLSKKDYIEYKLALKKAQKTGDVSEFVKVSDYLSAKASNVPLFIKRTEEKERERKEKWLGLIEREDKKIKEIEKAVKEKKPEKLDRFLKIPADKHLFFEFKNQKDNWL